VRIYVMPASRESFPHPPWFRPCVTLSRPPIPGCTASPAKWVQSNFLAIRFCQDFSTRCRASLLRRDRGTWAATSEEVWLQVYLPSDDKLATAIAAARWNLFTQDSFNIDARLTKRERTSSNLGPQRGGICTTRTMAIPAP
jgi:hypothetical protein